MRSLTRTRKQLVREQTRHVQRIEKTLAEANIQLGSVISAIMGASGRRMIEAMIKGVRQPRQLAELAGKQIKATPKQLYDALHGRLTDHHRFLLELHLKQWDGLDETIRKIDREIDQRIAGMHTKAGSGEVPFRTLIELLSTVPGISTVSVAAFGAAAVAGDGATAAGRPASVPSSEDNRRLMPLKKATETPCRSGAAEVE